MKKTWLRSFLAGLLTGVVALGALVTLIQSRPAEAQLPAMANEEIQIFREMSASLKGIEQALQTRCP